MRERRCIACREIIIIKDSSARYCKRCAELSISLSSRVSPKLIKLNKKINEMEKRLEKIEELGGFIMQRGKKQ